MIVLKKLEEAAREATGKAERAADTGDLYLAGEMSRFAADIYKITARWRVRLKVKGDGE